MGRHFLQPPLVMIFPPFLRWLLAEVSHWAMGSPIPYATPVEVLLRAVNLRRGTYGFTSLPKEVIGLLRIFYALKNPSTPEGFEPPNLGSSVPVRFM